MSWLSFFKKKEDTPAPPAPTGTIAAGEKLTIAPAQPLDTSNSSRHDPEFVEVFDEFGRKRRIAPEEFRTKLLPAGIEQHWTDPQGLYSTIIDALRLKMGAGSEPLVAAARQLRAIDPDRERSAVTLSIVLRENNAASEALQLLQQQIAQAGESAVLLVNLAKAQIQGEQSLWRAVELDPNFENGLGWFAAIARERQPASPAAAQEAAYTEALTRAAALPGSWLPQMWLGNQALKQQDQAAGLRFYEQALARAPQPAPAVLLQTISGELGKRGLLADALRLIQPRYDALAHGLPVGNNLIKLQLETGQLPEAAATVETLQRLNRPDWAATLSFWETEINKARLACEPAVIPDLTPDPAGPVAQLSNFGVDRPLWLQPGSLAEPLFPTSPSLAAGRVIFLAGTVTPESGIAPLQPHLADRMGRLSRMWPLFAAEQLLLHAGLPATATIPWVSTGGFAVYSEPFKDGEAATLARQSGGAYAVTLHLTPAGEQVTLSLRLLSLQEQAPELLDSRDHTYSWSEVHLGVKALLAQVRSLLPATSFAPPARYTLPPDALLGNYILRLEQLLAVACASGQPPESQGLNGERDIVRGMLELSLEAPASLPPRLILHEALRRFLTLRPAIAAEMRDPVLLLQSRYPMPDPETNAVLLTQLDTLYPAAQNAPPAEHG